MVCKSWIRLRIAAATVVMAVAAAGCNSDPFYGYLEVLVDGSRRVIQPIDYVGESFIGEGRFTYVISVDPSTLNPSMTMVKDG
jgi:hypothetical protein